MVGKSVSLCVLLGSLGGVLGCRAGPVPAEPPEASSDEGWVEAVDSWVYDGAWPSEPGPSDPAAPQVGEAPSSGAPAGSTPTARDPEAQRKLERTLLEASAAIQDDRWTQAVQLLETAREGAPAGDARMAGLLTRALGDAYLAVRRDAEAAEMYRALIAGEARALPGPSARAEARGNLAVAYLRMGDLEQARAQAEGALRIFPGYADALKTRGMIDILQGEVETGRRRLEESLRGGRRIPEAELMLARLDEQEGRLESALARYRALADAYDQERSRDTHRRWRDLCIDEGSSTPDALAARIDRLEELLRKLQAETVETQEYEASDTGPSAPQAR